MRARRVQSGGFGNNLWRLMAGRFLKAYPDELEMERLRQNLFL